MHKAWSSIEEVPYCFWRSYVKLQGHTPLKIVDLTQIVRFRTVSPVWIHQWLRNDAQSLKYHRTGALLFFKVIHQFARSRGSKNRRFWPKLGVSGLYLHFEIIDGYEIMHKAWSCIEEVSYCFSRSYIKFQGHTALKIVKFHPNWAFRTVTQVWIHQWLRNDAQSLK